MRPEKSIAPPAEVSILFEMLMYSLIGIAITGYLVILA